MTERPRRRKARDRLLACWRVVQKLIRPVLFVITVVKLIRELFDR